VIRTFSGGEQINLILIFWDLGVCWAHPIEYQLWVHFCEWILGCFRAIPVMGAIGEPLRQIRIVMKKLASAT